MQRIRVATIQGNMLIKWAMVFFDIRYLVEAIDVIGSVKDISIDLDDNHSPLLIFGKDITAILMPIVLG